MQVVRTIRHRSYQAFYRILHFLAVAMESRGRGGGGDFINREETAKGIYANIYFTPTYLGRHLTR